MIDTTTLRAALEKVTHLDGTLEWHVDDDPDGDMGAIRDQHGSLVAVPCDVPSAGDALEVGTAIAAVLTEASKLLKELEAARQLETRWVRCGICSTETRSAQHGVGGEDQGPMTETASGYCSGCGSPLRKGGRPHPSYERHRP